MNLDPICDGYFGKRKIEFSAGSRRLDNRTAKRQSSSAKTPCKSREVDGRWPPFSGTGSGNTQFNQEASGIRMKTYAVVLERTDTGFSSYAPDLPGCVAAGRTMVETFDLMQTAN
jgi:hypothetical protein